MGIVHKTWLCSASVNVPQKQPFKSKCTYKPGGVFHSVRCIAASFSKYGTMFGVGVSITGKDSSRPRKKKKAAFQCLVI